jgi:CHAT domain-containing protein
MTDTQESPDEFIGLPTGFLQAGATGVVSTLWAVSDKATSLLIKHFYRKHMNEGLPPDQALRSAQLWLRDATRQELGETYKSITRMSQNEAYRELVMDGDPGEKPYANPYYWAAFTLTGK